MSGHRHIRLTLRLLHDTVSLNGVTAYYTSHVLFADRKRARAYYIQSRVDARIAPLLYLLKGRGWQISKSAGFL